MSSLATSHVDTSFINSFGNALEDMRKVWLSAADAQPFVVAGSGTLTWDMTAANLLEKGILLVLIWQSRRFSTSRKLGNIR